MASLDSVSLNDSQVVWTDEFAGTPVAQSAEVDINGGLVVEYVGANKDGRAVTLDLGWITKSTLDALVAKRDAETQSLMTLTLPDGRTMDVLWRHHDAEPIEAEPIQEFVEYADGDYFQVVLNLMQVL